MSSQKRPSDNVGLHPAVPPLLHWGGKILAGAASIVVGAFAVEKIDNVRGRGQPVTILPQRTSGVSGAPSADLGRVRDFLHRLHGQNLGDGQALDSDALLLNLSADQVKKLRAAIDAGMTPQEILIAAGVTKRQALDTAKPVAQLPPVRTKKDCCDACAKGTGEACGCAGVGVGGLSAEYLAALSGVDPDDVGAHSPTHHAKHGTVHGHAPTRHYMHHGKWLREHHYRRPLNGKHVHPHHKVAHGHVHGVGDLGATAAMCPGNTAEVGFAYFPPWASAGAYKGRGVWMSTNACGDPIEPLGRQLSHPSLSIYGAALLATERAALTAQQLAANATILAQAPAPTTVPGSTTPPPVTVNVTLPGGGTSTSTTASDGSTSTTDDGTTDDGTTDDGTTDDDDTTDDGTSGLGRVATLRREAGHEGAELRRTDERLSRERHVLGREEHEVRSLREEVARCHARRNEHGVSVAEMHLLHHRARALEHMLRLLTLAVEGATCAVEEDNHVIAATMVTPDGTEGVGWASAAFGGNLGASPLVLRREAGHEAAELHHAGERLRHDHALIRHEVGEVHALRRELAKCRHTASEGGLSPRDMNLLTHKARGLKTMVRVLERVVVDVAEMVERDSERLAADMVPLDGTEGVGYVTADWYYFQWQGGAPRQVTGPVPTEGTEAKDSQFRDMLSAGNAQPIWRVKRESSDGPTDRGAVTVVGSVDGDVGWATRVWGYKVEGRWPLTFTKDGAAAPTTTVTPQTPAVPDPNSPAPTPAQLKLAADAAQKIKDAVSPPTKTSGVENLGASAHQVREMRAQGVPDREIVDRIAAEGGGGHAGHHRDHDRKRHEPKRATRRGVRGVELSGADLEYVRALGGIGDDVFSKAMDVTSVVVPGGALLAAGGRAAKDATDKATGHKVSGAAQAAQVSGTQQGAKVMSENVNGESNLGAAALPPHRSLRTGNQTVNVSRRGEMIVNQADLGRWLSQRFVSRRRYRQCLAHVRRLQRQGANSIAAIQNLQQLLAQAQQSGYQGGGYSGPDLSSLSFDVPQTDLSDDGAIDPGDLVDDGGDDMSGYLGGLAGIFDEAGNLGAPRGPLSLRREDAHLRHEVGHEAAELHRTGQHARHLAHEVSHEAREVHVLKEELRRCREHHARGGHHPVELHLLEAKIHGLEHVVRVMEHAIGGAIRFVEGDNRMIAESMTSPGGTRQSYPGGYNASPHWAHPHAGVAGWTPPDQSATRPTQPPQGQNVGGADNLGRGGGAGGGGMGRNFTGGMSAGAGAGGGWGGHGSGGWGQRGGWGGYSGGWGGGYGYDPTAVVAYDPYADLMGTSRQPQNNVGGAVPQPRSASANVGGTGSTFVPPDLTAQMQMRAQGQNLGGLTRSGPDNLGCAAGVCGVPVQPSGVGGRVRRSDFTPPSDGVSGSGWGPTVGRA